MLYKTITLNNLNKSKIILNIRCSNVVKEVPFISHYTCFHVKSKFTHCPAKLNNYSAIKLS